MGFDNHIHLFNLKVYRERVLPAYRAFLDSGDSEIFIPLIRECISILEANPQLSNDLLMIFYGIRRYARKILEYLMVLFTIIPKAITGLTREREKRRARTNSFTLGRLFPLIFFRFFAYRITKVQILCKT